MVKDLIKRSNELLGLTAALVTGDLDGVFFVGVFLRNAVDAATFLTLVFFVGFLVLGEGVLVLVVFLTVLLVAFLGVLGLAVEERLEFFCFFLMGALTLLERLLFAGVFLGGIRL